MFREQFQGRQQHPQQVVSEKKIRIIKAKAEIHQALLFFLSICPPLGLLPVLGPLERYATPTLDAALLISSRAGADLG